MKIGALTFFQRMHCNGAPSKSILLAAWHWKWSLTWRWHLSWRPGLSGRVGPYFMRTYRYKPGLNFCAGVNLPLLGSFNVQTQPNMHLTPNVIYGAKVTPNLERRMTTMNNEDPAAPSVHEQRVTDAPAEIWLVYGELEHDDTHANLIRDGDVTWCEHQIEASDVRYVRADLLADALDSAAFYRRRCAALGQWQSRMRDPERIIVCDILANGTTLTPPGSRYDVPEPLYTAEELAQHMENDCMLVGWDDVPAMLRSQATEIARLRETLNFIATHFSSDWPERCQSNVLAARHALTQGPNVF